MKLGLSIVGSVLVAAAMSFVPVGQAAAQSGMQMAFTRDILVGPFATGGVALNAGPVSNGVSTSAGASFNGGVMGIVPLSEGMALSIGLAYDTRSYSMSVSGGGSADVDNTMGYFSIRPELKYKSFHIGAGIGLPMSVNANVDSIGNTTDATRLNTLVEGRLGFDFPIYIHEGNMLMLLVEGSYGFTKVFKDGGDNGNGPLATAQAGLAYMFDIYHGRAY